MLGSLCLCITVTAAVALDLTGRKTAHLDLSALQNYTYSDFVSEFKRKISPDFEEWPVREGLFNENLRKIQALRNIPGIKWEPGITKFMDYHDHEYNRLLGYKGRRARAALATRKRQDDSDGRPRETRKQSVVDGDSQTDDFQINFSFDDFFWDDPTYGVRRQGSVEDYMPEEQTPSAFNVVHYNSTASIVHDQGICGSCWADAAMSALEGVIEKDANLMDAIRKKIGSSTQPYVDRDYAVACTENPMNCGGTGGCNGATSELAFKLALEKGIPLMRRLVSSQVATIGVASQCPQEVQLPRIRTLGYTTLPQNQPHLRAALIQQGSPISVAVDATNWNLYTSGVYSDMDVSGRGEFTVNHMVALVGYDVRKDPHPYYLIKNSWGPDFGEKGYIRVEMKNNEPSHCGWDREAHLGVACDDEPDRAWVCGTCGILFDVSFPMNAVLVDER